MYDDFGYQCCYLTKTLSARKLLESLRMSTSCTPSWYLQQCPSGGK